MKDEAEKIAVQAVEAALMPPKAEIELICLEDVDAKPVSWLWKKRIARGKLTIVAGNPGLGKSQLTADMSATVTTGGQWPDGSHTVDAGNVIILSAEDDPADTIKPRLVAAGADVTKCHVLSAVKTSSRSGEDKSRHFDLTQDVERLGIAIEQKGNVHLVIIDPVSAYLGGTDSNNNSDIRGVLAPLADMASKYDVAIILVTHLNKSKDQDLMARVIGSMGMIAAARAGYVVSKDEVDPDIRYFLPIKNNIGNDSDGFAFHIEGVTLSQGIETSRVCWHEGVVNAHKVLNPEKKTQTNGAQAFLLEILSSGGRIASEVFEEAKGMGYSKSSIQRAAGNLKIVRRKMGMKDGWMWSLPSPVTFPEGAEDDEGLNFS